MAIKPILFSGPMVRALLDGRKTQTRRVLKPIESQRLMCRSCGATEREFKADLCKCEDFALEWTPCEPPSYRKGDLLWVREEHRIVLVHEGARRSADIAYEASGSIHHLDWPDRCELPTPGSVRTSMFMPRECSRLTLRVTEVRVQRLQEISEEDARAEAPVSEYTVGQARADDALSWDNISPDAPDDAPLYIAEFRDDDSDYALSLSARDGFSALWDSLNAKRAGGAFSWDSNPWVVAVSFEVIAGNIDQVKESAVS